VPAWLRQQKGEFMDGASAEESAAELGKLLRNYSAEVTSGDRKSIEAAKRMMAPGAEVLIASLPSDPADRQVSVAAELKDAGLTPVPHVVVAVVGGEVRHRCRDLMSCRPSPDD